MTRIAVVGGGSTHWTPTLLVDFANAPALTDIELIRSQCPRCWVSICAAATSPYEHVVAMTDELLAATAAWLPQFAG